MHCLTKIIQTLTCPHDADSLIGILVDIINFISIFLRLFNEHLFSHVGLLFLLLSSFKLRRDIDLHIFLIQVLAFTFVFSNKSFLRVIVEVDTTVITEKNLDSHKKSWLPQKILTVTTKIRTPTEKKSGLFNMKFFYLKFL